MERELWTLLYAVATKLDKRWGHWKYSTADILVVYFWCVVCDRPMCWGTQKTNWPEDLCPGQSNVNSRKSLRLASRRRPRSSHIVCVCRECSL